jgi:hypothetical protein
VKRLVGLFSAAAAICLPLLGTGTAAAQVATSSVLRPGVAHLAHLRNDTVTSTNWGGYAVEDASQFTDVQGTWVQPAATCSSRSTQYASFWVGIDGYSSNSVEQLGTDSDCTGRNRPSYYAWYEMYPANSVNISTKKYPVRAGDTLTAEVKVSGTSFTLSLKSSEGWSFSTTQTGSGLAQSSAEWIAESPEICGGRNCTLAQLADFNSISFSNAVAAVAGGSDQPISAFTNNGGPHDIICETSSGTPRDTPSSLGSSGNAFSIAWEHD